MHFIESSPFKPSFYKRYIDDTLLIWPHGLDHLSAFVPHLNGLADIIRLTAEVQADGRFLLLDLLIIRRLDGTLGRMVFPKPTHTNLYLSNSSSCPGALDIGNPY